MRKSPLDTRPERRTLRIYAFDPMQARGGDLRVAVEVPYRELAWSEASFSDDRIELIDYDAATQRTYRAVNLDDPHIAVQNGLEPVEADPQFHQQMVYAVTARVLENFDRALGRRLRFWGGQRLRLFPHAFQGRNAYYDDRLNGVLFGYFQADEDNPGANLPGQTVFTCLSHDIVAHEVAHAALDRLHRFYRQPTNPHVPALHEAFADIVAIFQRFTLSDVVRSIVRETRGDLLKHPNALQEIGAQFGTAAGQGGALRSAGGPVDASAFARTREPHALGRILVSAVFEGFIRTYQKRTADLLRIATGGSGSLPDGELHPDLVNRLATECARTAQSVLSMCIRATDYLPPVDPTFSDFLRGMITADFELNRIDELGLRAAVIEAFRIRGIRPESVGSLAVESILLEVEDQTVAMDPVLADIVRRLLQLGIREMSRNTGGQPRPTMTSPPPSTNQRRAEKVGSSAEWFSQLQSGLSTENEDAAATAEEEPDEEWRNIASALGGWAKLNRQRIGLDAVLPARLTAFHPVHRVATTGELLVEMVAHFVQTKSSNSDELGGLAYRAGVTVVATHDGRIRYLIKKPFHEEREKALTAWVAAFDDDEGPTWRPGRRRPNRITEAFSARAMDSRRWQ